MKRFILTIFAFILGLTIVFAQFADPAVTGASYSSNQINKGQTSVLIVSFANTGSTTIPVNSIELTISTAYSYYTSNSNMAPTGPGAMLFTWKYIGTTGVSDVWRGTNNVDIGAFGGGNILLTVTGNTVSSSFETTNINIQPVNNFNKFFDSPINNNLQPQLKVNQGCPPSPVLLANTKNNVCPLTTADLTTLQPADMPPGQTFEWHTVSSNPTASTLVSSPTQVTAGTYYLYAYEICYSPASQPAIVTINTCTNPVVLVLNKTAPKIATLGIEYTYTLMLSNTGTANTNGLLSVSDTLSKGLVFKSVVNSTSAGWTCQTNTISVNNFNRVLVNCQSNNVINPNSVQNISFAVVATEIGNYNNQAFIDKSSNGGITPSNIVVTSVINEIACKAICVPFSVIKSKAK